MPPLACSWTRRVGMFALGALALLLFAATLFFLISDDFVINGQVVPATGARFIVLPIVLAAAGTASATLAWLCHRRLVK